MLTTLALVVLLTFAGLAIDVGLAALSAQQCQAASDAGAMSGAQGLPDGTLATSMAQAVASANPSPATAAQFTREITCYNEGDIVPGCDEPAPLGGAVLVRTSRFVNYHFLRVIGRSGLLVARTSVATKIVSGQCIAPIWIGSTTPVSYGVATNLLMASAPHYAGIPGSFGFLVPNGGVDFDDALKGTLTLDEEELQRTYKGDLVWAYTGLKVGPWVGALVRDADSRPGRGTSGEWAGDTFEVYRADNPRIMIVPMVDYLYGTGSGAVFRVVRLAAFWLEAVDKNAGIISGRFIDFTKAGGTGSRIITTHLVG